MTFIEIIRCTLGGRLFMLMLLVFLHCIWLFQVFDSSGILWTFQVIVFAASSSFCLNYFPKFVEDLFRV
ncbi:MAG: hypothetical protein CDV28_13431 [Candidatus Electronema aureum]|uniref:Uncharacterized protein n=1 Tax=Candidatus Electronema aureum TaxID=2005002 RepID=A0A521FZP7_9BACT|nr:MAG: hypothetical protein CDV28_13431 [Candidatus Electronema aureum]